MFFSLGDGTFRVGLKHTVGDTPQCREIVVHLLGDQGITLNKGLFPLAELVKGVLRKVAIHDEEFDAFLIIEDAADDFCQRAFSDTSLLGGKAQKDGRCICLFHCDRYFYLLNCLLGDMPFERLIVR